MKDGVPSGEYEDFVTGFVTEDGRVWGRPVGIAEAKDGSLLFSDDENGTIWRVSYIIAKRINYPGQRRKDKGIPARNHGFFARTIATSSP